MLIFETASLIQRWREVLPSFPSYIYIPSPTMSTITIHHLEASRSQRVLWLMEHLSIPYSIKLHKRSPQTKLNEGSLGEVHPLKRSPVLVDSKGGQEITVPETGAICELDSKGWRGGQMERTPLELDTNLAFSSNSSVYYGDPPRQTSKVGGPS